MMMNNQLVKQTTSQSKIQPSVHKWYQKVFSSRYRYRTKWRIERKKKLETFSKKKQKCSKVGLFVNNNQLSFELVFLPLPIVRLVNPSCKLNFLFANRWSIRWFFFLSLHFRSLLYSNFPGKNDNN